MAFDFPSAPTVGQDFSPAAGLVYSWNGYAWMVKAAPGGGGGGGAPTDAEYVTSSANPTLSAERVLTNSPSVVWDFATAGQAKATVVGGGGASITVSDTPPASPAAGALWWESDSGRLYIYYNDGNTSQWVAVAAGASSTITPAPQAGRLSFVSATQLSFKPFNGNRIRLNGVDYPIPNAGIPGLGNTGVYVNGIAGQNLAANTFYTIYAMIQGGIVTANFRNDAPGTHRPSQQAGNEGVEVMFLGPTEYNDHTLIGICRTNASSQFADSNSQRLVNSWFNRYPLNTETLNTVNATAATTTFAAFNPANMPYSEFVIWADQVASWQAQGSIFINSASYNAVAAVGFDATITAEPQQVMTNHTSQVPFGIGGRKKFSEGYHYGYMLIASQNAAATATIFGGASAGTTTFTGLAPATMTIRIS